MTTLTPTMEAMLAELAALTKARRDNWNGQDQPRNADLEAEHLRELRFLKAAIAAEDTANAALAVPKKSRKNDKIQP